jgi:hypothetical protein
MAGGATGRETPVDSLRGPSGSTRAARLSSTWISTGYLQINPEAPPLHVFPGARTGVPRPSGKSRIHVAVAGSGHFRGPAQKASRPSGRSSDGRRVSAATEIASELRPRTKLPAESAVIDACVAAAGVQYSRSECCIPGRRCLAQGGSRSAQEFQQPRARAAGRTVRTRSGSTRSDLAGLGLISRSGAFRQVSWRRSRRGPTQPLDRRGASWSRPRTGSGVGWG